MIIYNRHDLTCAQPCANGLTKSDEAVVTISAVHLEKLIGHK